MIVVCRYNESLDWLKNLNKEYIIYNKGDDNLPSWIKKVHKIENISFEEYAYLKFLVDYYDKIPDRVTFLQGNSITHNPDILQLLDLEDKYSEVQPLSAYYSPEVPGDILTNLTKCLWIKDCKIHVNFFDNKLQRYNIETHSFDYYPKSDRFLFDFLKTFYNSNNVKDGMFNQIKIKARVFDNKDMSPMCFGALFSINKKNILKHNRYYYKYLLNLSTKLQHHKKIFAWIMELCWLELFGYEPPTQIFKDNFMSLQYMCDKNPNWKYHTNKYCINMQQAVSTKLLNYTDEKIKSCCRFSSLLQISLEESAKHLEFS